MPRDPVTISSELTLRVGNNSDFYVYTLDESEGIRSLAGYARCRLALYDDLSNPPLIEWDTADNSLALTTIDGDSVLVADGISDSQWEGIAPGRYVLDGALFQTSSSQWHRTRPIAVIVLKSGLENPS